MNFYRQKEKLSSWYDCALAHKISSYVRIRYCGLLVVQWLACFYSMNNCTANILGIIEPLCIHVPLIAQLNAEIAIHSYSVAVLRARFFTAIQAQAFVSSLCY